MRLAAHNELVSWLQTAIWYSCEFLATFVVDQENKWYYYVIVIFVGPIVEEILYRRCLLEGLKCVFRMLPSTHTEKRSNAAAASVSLVTPWAILTSICFAVGHIDLGAICYPEYLSNSFMGRMRLAQVTALVVYAFAASLLILTPIYEKYGIFGSIGAHAVCNFLAIFPRFEKAILAYNFLHHAFNRRTYTFYDAFFGESGHWEIYTFAVPVLYSLLYLLGV